MSLPTLSAAIVRRADELTKQRLDQLADAQPSTSQSPPEQSQGQPHGEPAPALPEAPASGNVHVTVAGRKVQVTLRDSNEQRLLARLEALLQRFPAEEEPQGEQAPPEGWCRKHGIQMTLRNGEHGSWWSHKTAEGWCKGK